VDYEQQATVIDFFDYPPVGSDDWRYTYQTAVVRVLETQMPAGTLLRDLAEAADYSTAVELLGQTEYGEIRAVTNSGEMEQFLLSKRTMVRRLFSELMLDKNVVYLMRCRDDFANMRLAVRRFVMQQPIEVDYSEEGNIHHDQFEEVFEGENYDLFPDHMARAVEQAVLRHYADKDIRQVDYAIDAVEADHKLREAGKIGGVFLRNLFRIEIDLNNIRTMLRLKWAESEQKDVFIEGGYVETQRFIECLNAGYESLADMFFATPYYRILGDGVNYLTTEKSFLKLECLCEEYMAGYLKSTSQISAGPQPVIAYLLARENEIRKIRMILTAKRNHLDKKLILDRLAGGNN
jgi:V/A-type H+-transporting ATPase subunit C